MKHRWISKLICALLFFAAAFLAMAPLGRVAPAAGSDWMSQIEDSTPVNQLSIPGTHDSGALHSIADLTLKCQSTSISDQLNMGVRFFDIRLRLVGDDLCVVHSFADQGLSFSSVAECMDDFLKRHPGEFLLVSIKEDAAPLRSSISFRQAVEGILSEYSETFSFGTELPTSLGDTRGKAFIISRYKNASIGIPAWEGWADSASFRLGSLYIQDNYCIGDLSVKKADIQAALSTSASCEFDLVLNFTSCYLDRAFPPSYAGTAAGEINPWLPSALAESEGCLGVVICDFMTEPLSEAIYGRNFQ